MTVSRPDFDEYARLLRGELDGGGNRRIVRHLLKAWRVCRSELGQIWEGGQTFAARDYSPAFSGLIPRLGDHVRRVAQERESLPSLLLQLRERSPEEQPALMRSDESFHSWLLGEWLIEESQRWSYVDLGRAEALAKCAVTLVEELDPGIYGAPLIDDLRARAWACAGEAFRLLSDLRSAEEAFENAEEFIANGTGDALEDARVRELKAALYRDQRRWVEAHRQLDDVIAVYRQYRDLHLLGRAFVQKGRVYGNAGNLQKAVAWLRKGLGLIDPTRERYLDLGARHSLMLCLHESGRAREARFLLAASRPEFLQHGSPLLICRLRWLEGKIHQALGFLTEAETALTEARQGFAGLKIGFSAAAVSLDLAGLYAIQGRAVEVRALAEEILPIFQSRGLQQEAIAALIAFRQAAERETTNAKGCAEIQACLAKVREDPKLRCEPL